MVFNIICCLPFLYENIEYAKGILPLLSCFGFLLVTDGCDGNAVLVSSVSF